MTLRLRMVVAIVALAMVGLGVFGIALTSFYSRSQYQRTDERLRSSVPMMGGRLMESAGLGGPFEVPGTNGRVIGNTDPTDLDAPDRPTLLAADTYAELRSSAGETLASVTLSDTEDAPVITNRMIREADAAGFFNADSENGDVSWRVHASSDPRISDATIIVAVPLSEVSNSINRLILIEVIAGLGLLTLIGGGSWLILRHGLRPLEQMAESASSITSGDLAQRVSPSGGNTEVGQLGLALNTMLSDIELAFDERDRTEQRLRQFLADASHELRTPLTSIQGFAELFRLGAEDDPETLRVILRRIEEESDRMKALVEELLLLAHLDETRPAERVEVDLAVLAADACTDASATAPDREVTLTAPEPVVVIGDVDHLRQAIANLVTNALRHTPDGTAIGVTVERDGNDALITVRDHGSGLDDEALAHAFDRFWRADSARAGSGTGLGLSIVAGIADEHGGSVTAQNAPDGGAVFVIRVPIDLT